MTRSHIIARREIASYFYSPLAYVALTLFLVGTGILFWFDFQPGQPAGLRTIFDWMVWLLVVIVPVLCMGLLAQERSSGTIETLMTAPLGEGDVVLGKFFGALGFILILLLPTLLYVVLLRIYSRVDLGPIFSGYLGIFLVAALFTSVGLFCSSLTGAQTLAAVGGVTILFLITIVPWWVGRQQGSTLPAIWRRAIDLGIYNRYVDFSKGVVDTSHVIFFVVLTGVFLFVTAKVLESRRWK